MTTLPKPHNKHMSKGGSYRRTVHDTTQRDGFFFSLQFVSHQQYAKWQTFCTYLAGSDAFRVNTFYTDAPRSVHLPRASSLQEQSRLHTSTCIATDSFSKRSRQRGENQCTAIRPVTMNCATTKPPSLSLHHSSPQPDLQARDDSTSTFAGDEKEKLCTKLRTVKRIRSALSIQCGLRGFATR